MRTFLRKIRRSLIDSGATRKYLVYAIGEILLVMIGILLALQVNNWNTNRNAKKVEKSMLLGIKKSLQSDLENTIGNNIKFTKTLTQLTDAIIRESKLGTRGSDTLDYSLLARNKNFDPNTILHEILQSKGVDIIRNEELRLSIINIYNLEYKILTRFFENEKNNVRDMYRPKLRKWFNQTQSSGLDGGKYIPINYSGMLKDREFINIIIISYNINNGLNWRLQQLQTNVEAVIQEIEKELERF